MNEYIFKSDRLGFRNWQEGDIAAMAEINADPTVMAFFPNQPSVDDTKNFVHRMQEQYKERGFCYFAVDRLDNDGFIGFIGLSYQDYESGFTPCVDIGWRLKQSEWRKGFATEGAKACLKYGFEAIGLTEIYAIAPVLNVNSERVMKKIGMQNIGVFHHPLLSDSSPLKECVVYRKMLLGKRLVH